MHLTIRDLSKRYGNGVQALAAVSLDVPPGMFGLLGPNGAGKSTLMRTLATLQSADSGSATLGDIDVLKYLRQHYAIKRFVAACARNPFAATAIAPCHAISRRFFFVHCQRPHDVPTAAKHHADIVRSIALGDEAGARAASDKLMDWLDEFTRATVMRRY